MAEAKKLGDMLKEEGLIDDFQLQSALSHQRNWGGKLGHILVEMEFVREEDIARVVAEKLGIPYFNLFEPELTESAIKLLKPDVAKKYHVMPVGKEKGALVLAMSDPLDIESIDEIRFITGQNIKPVLAMKSEIRDAISKYYDGESITRDSSSSLFHMRSHSDGGKMEIIRGSDLNMPKVPKADESSPILPSGESASAALQDCKIRIDALTSLLIEKGIISREDLVSMIYQKKLGL